MKCAGCQRWVHRVCGLINAVGAMGTSDIFCPPCLADSLRNGARSRVRLPYCLSHKSGVVTTYNAAFRPKQGLEC